MSDPRALPPGMAVLERGWLSSNNVVFHDPDGVSVVDTGYVTHGEQTLALVAQALRGRPLVRIVNTHLHSDHAGGNALLQRHHPACRTLIPPGQRDAVDAWDEDQLSYRSTGQQCDRFTVDEVLDQGQSLRLGGLDWAVLPAAGHDEHMVMLWCEREGILISADALWRNGFGVIFPELAGEPGFDDQQATLDLISQLALRLVIPGHGSPFAEVDAALKVAHSRIQWLMQDPRRNADNALKGLVAFKLLAARQMTMADVSTLIGEHLLPLPGIAPHYPADPDALAAWVTEQLVRSQAADLCGDTLYART
jgi:glyoxylase-like metal-dependent hydrolase (beta-lactamase superfamily II)